MSSKVLHWLIYCHHFDAKKLKIYFERLCSLEVQVRKDDDNGKTTTYQRVAFIHNHFAIKIGKLIGESFSKETPSRMECEKNVKLLARTAFSEGFKYKESFVKKGILRGDRSDS